MASMTLSEANAEVTKAYIDLAPLLTGVKRGWIDQILVISSAPMRTAALLKLGYALRDDLDQPMRDRIADIGQIAVDYQFDGLGDDDIGLKMIALLRGNSLPAGASAPDPDPAYIEQPVTDDTLPVQVMPA